MKILGLAGLAGSGKDYIANITVDHMLFHKLPMALPGKIMLGATECFNYTDLFVNKGTHTRTRMQQYINDEMKIVHGMDVWTKAWWLMAEYFHHEHGWHSIVIPDIRFQVEIDFIQSRGGRVLYVHAPHRAAVYANNRLTVKQQNHSSEQVKDFQFICDGYVYNDNDGSERTLNVLLNYFTSWSW